MSKPEVTQTQIRFVCPGVPRNHPDFYPIRVANTILGAGFTSRLVNEIRVVQGLTYSISSRFSMNRRAGIFGISTFTRNATLRKTIDATLGEVRKLRDEGPTEAEFDKAKRYLTGQFPLGLQAPDDLAEALLDVEFYGLGARLPADLHHPHQRRHDGRRAPRAEVVLLHRRSLDPGGVESGNGEEGARRPGSDRGEGTRVAASDRRRA